ncbi:hypothetical protein [Rhodopirellula sallentina]|nr:hypothetical protein [Rhodopirellula sallentina]
MMQDRGIAGTRVLQGLVSPSNQYRCDEIEHACEIAWRHQDWMVAMIGVAAGYLVVAWCDGSLFAGVRGWLSHDMISEYLVRWCGDRFRCVGDKLTTLLLCPMCLSPYVCLAIWILARLRVGTPLFEDPFTLALGTFASAAVSYGTYRLLSYD